MIATLRLVPTRLVPTRLAPTRLVPTGLVPIRLGRIFSPNTNTLAYFTLNYNKLMEKMFAFFLLKT